MESDGRITDQPSNAPDTLSAFQRHGLTILLAIAFAVIALSMVIG